MNIETPFDDLDLKNKFKLGNDLNLSPESLDMLKNLNSESKKLERSKEDLKKRLLNINSKISSSNDVVNENFNKNIKDEILFEINPKIEKINLEFSQLSLKFLDFKKIIEENNSNSNLKFSEKIENIQLGFKVEQKDFFLKIKNQFEELKNNLQSNSNNYFDNEKINNTNALNLKIEKINDYLDHLKNLNFDELSSNFIIEKKNLQDQINSLKSDNLNNSNNSNLDILKNNLTKLENNFENSSTILNKDILGLKSEILNLNHLKGEFKLNETIENKINDLDDKFKKLNIENQLNFQKENFEGQLNNLKISFNNKISELPIISKDEIAVLKSEVSDLKNSILKLNSPKLKDDFKVFIKEEVSGQILNLNKFQNDISKEIKLNISNIETSIENKFINSKKQFDDEFKLNIETFDFKLKEKEKEFLNKLLILEDEKNLSIYELEKFRDEVSKITSGDILKLKTEFENFKLSSLNFKKEKSDFLNEIEQKKEALRDFSFDLGLNLKKTINDESDRFEIHENTFREIFNEKIRNLQIITEDKLKTIEKKFVDKNVKLISDKIQIEVEELENIKKNILTKDTDLDLKFKDFNLKISEGFSKLKLETGDIKEKNQERLTELEKQFNKKFSNYDGEFKNFKNIVVEEIENLMKDVKTVVSDSTLNYDKKLSEFDLISKNNFKLLNKSKNEDALFELEKHFNKKFSNLNENFHDFKNMLISEVKLIIKDIVVSNSKSFNSEVISELKNNINNLTKKVDLNILNSKSSEVFLNEKNNSKEISSLQSQILNLQSLISNSSNDADISSNQINLSKLKSKLNSLISKSNKDLSLESSRIDSLDSDLSSEVFLGGGRDLEISSLQSQILNLQSLISHSSNDTDISVNRSNLSKLKSKLNSLISKSSKDLSLESSRIDSLDSDLSSEVFLGGGRDLEISSLQSQILNLQSLISHSSNDTDISVNRSNLSKLKSKLNSLISKSNKNSGLELEHFKNLNSKLNELSFKGDGYEMEISALQSQILKLKSKLDDNLEFNKLKNKLNYIDKKLEQETLDNFNHHELEIENLKTKVNYLNSKINKTNSYSINDQVEKMAEYEDRLIGLINNLKYRNFSQNKIKEILVNKGHPKFYITMILNNI